MNTKSNDCRHELGRKVGSLAKGEPVKKETCSLLFWTKTDQGSLETCWNIDKIELALLLQLWWDSSVRRTSTGRQSVAWRQRGCPGTGRTFLWNLPDPSGRWNTPFNSFSSLSPNVLLSFWVLLQHNLLRNSACSKSQQFVTIWQQIQRDHKKILFGHHKRNSWYQNINKELLVKTTFNVPAISIKEKFRLGHLCAVKSRAPTIHCRLFSWDSHYFLPRHTAHGGKETSEEITKKNLLKLLCSSLIGVWWEPSLNMMRKKFHQPPSLAILIYFSFSHSSYIIKKRSPANMENLDWELNSGEQCILPINPGL